MHAGDPQVLAGHELLRQGQGPGLVGARAAASVPADVPLGPDPPPVRLRHSLRPDRQLDRGARHPPQKTPQGQHSGLRLEPGLRFHPAAGRRPPALRLQAAHPQLDHGLGGVLHVAHDAGTFEQRQGINGKSATACNILSHTTKIQILALLLSLIHI